MTGPSTGRDATAGTTAKKKRKPRETVVPPQMSTRSKSKQKTQINQSPGASLVDWYKKRNSLQPDAEKFVSKLKSKYFTIEGNDSYLNWQVFGGFAGACFNAPPSNVCFLNGLLDQGPNKIGPAANGLLDEGPKKISPVEKGAPAATIMREEGAPLDYWKPSSPTRRRRDIDNGEQSWAQQLRMKRELQPFMAGKESEEVGENFNEFLTGLDKMLQPKAHEEEAVQSSN
ncbi:unnamed protein product [Cylindrotheca closterium]|uniref:Uncharacterized protein n=1 Tax=Cylindrotheca closterium TaxID=2856 RepID=A0AAD2JMN0_9STRA|nr:unnamed protein product [Cylindrotheca closterium]